ncbi:phosphate ABC transporter permease PstA [Streptomyces sp. NPDC059740]|uniref:phosphate ABC transporter permease PstA n=1 Tax=Streptomyces sp. NPDC059740 TaxID=3346926 RepID=UPI00365733F6
MSDVLTDRTTTAEPAPAPTPRLRRAHLPRWAVPAFAAASVIVGCALGAVAGLTSHVQWGLLAAVFFLLLTTVVATLVEGGRKAKDRLATAVIWVAFLLAVVPLLSLLWETVARGHTLLNGYFLSHSMGTLPDQLPGGGIYHAIIGSLEQVGLATVVAVPIGLFTAIYLVEYGRGRLARAVTFFVDVMTGIPSIVAGLFIGSIVFLMLHLQPFGFAGSLALAILMTPVVVRSTEEMLKLVPGDLREASYALGVPRWRTILKVVLPTSVGGITTGVMLAIARIAGETAPVLLLVFGDKVINNDPFHAPQQSLPLFVYQQYALGTDTTQARAWAAALVLILFVMVLNLLARGIARWKAPKTGR